MTVAPGRPVPTSDVRLENCVILLSAAWILWILVAATATGADPTSPIALIVACLLVLAGARVIGRARPAAVPLLLIAAAALTAVASGPLLWSGSSTVPPFGYSNANAAFFSQAAIAGLMITVTTQTPWLRQLGTAATIVFAAIPILTGVRAAVMLLALLPLALVLRHVRGARAAIGACALVLGAALAVTTAITWAKPEAGTMGRLADRTISINRVRLWSEALEIVRTHPLLGVGPGEFANFSATAAADPDLRWAHNEFLQLAAESGIPGVACMLGVILCLFLLLASHVSRGGTLDVLADRHRARSRQNADAMAVLAAVALATVCVHATVDYILHFPAVPIAAAALVGAGLVATRNDRVDAFARRA